MSVTPKELISCGLKQGRWVPDAVEYANKHGIAATIEKFNPKTVPMQDEPAPFNVFLDADTGEEALNKEAVIQTMNEVMKTPGVVKGAVMPDACPAGPVGIIPVGGVVASKYIHPSMHSADVCCSLMLSEFDPRFCEPKEILDMVHQATHFGPGPRKDNKFSMSDELVEKFQSNSFLRDLVKEGHAFLGTQGDGNHFAYVGTSEHSQAHCLVTHHGSRKVGAMLYKRGMKAAKDHCKDICPNVKNPWLDYETEVGKEYWDALQIVRQWTKENHEAIHQSVLFPLESNFWNEHNFVFRKGDDLFYHAKGATPVYRGFSEDDVGLSIVPLNMSEPVLIVSGTSNVLAHNAQDFGFAPHGAGRNVSRTKHQKSLTRTNEEQFAHETSHIDARFYSGHIDTSELPSAYKRADAVVEQMEHYGLATVVDKILPYGCVMAGMNEYEWRKKTSKTENS